MVSEPVTKAGLLVLVEEKRANQTPLYLYVYVTAVKKRTGTDTSYAVVVI